MISHTSVNALLPKLAKELENLDPSVPVFIYGLDNSVIKATTAEGDWLSISRSAEDNKFHVKDDMKVVS